MRIRRKHVCSASEMFDLGDVASVDSVGMLHPHTWADLHLVRVIATKGKVVVTESVFDYKTEEE